MKQGSTFILSVNLDVDMSYVDSIIFTVKNKDVKLTKEDWTFEDGKFKIPFTQEETVQLEGRTLIESQINFIDKNVAKTKIETIYINPTLATRIIDGNLASIEGTEINLEVDGEIVYIGGSGGTSDYMHLENKPQINGVELIGNKSTKELGIEVPTKTSDLINDSGYITKEDIPSIDIPDVDLSEYATKEYVENYSVVLSHDGNGNATIEGLVVLVDGNEVEY